MLEPSRSSHESARTPARVAEWARVERAAAINCLRSPAYWHSLVAEHGLRVSEGPVIPGPAERWVSPSAAAGLAQPRADMAEQGYLHWRGLVDAERCTALARGVSTLCQHGWDAAFIALVDEAWELAFHLTALMGGVLQPSVLFRRELFSFCVDPKLAAGRPRGVPAHRDRPDSGYDRIDGLAVPRHCTCWVSLTEADETNGCMYVVPTRADDEASLAHAPVESERGRPLATRPGDLLAWNGQAVHWGGHYDPARARGSRIALAFSLTHEQIPSIGGFAPVQADTLPGFAERLSLVGTFLQWLNPPARGTAMDVVLELMRSRA